MFTLDNFEDGIDASFLQHGLEYFRGGRVLGLKEFDRDHWRARVKGSFDYTVEVTLSEREIIDSYCGCPYEGDFCKHEIAVFYALAGDTEKPKKSDDSLLDEMSKEQLLSLIDKARSEILEFDEFITAELELVNSANDKNSFKRIIRDSLNYAKDRHGFIDYWQSHKAVRGTEKVFDQGKNLEPVNQTAAIDAYGAIIETLVPALQYADDSNGALGEYIEQAFMGLGQIAQSKLSSQTRVYLINYCLSEYRDKKYDGWHFSLEFLRIAGEMATKQEKARLFNELDVYVAGLSRKSEYSSEYEAEKVALIKLGFIKKHESKDAADRFIEQNIHFNDIREEAVRSAIKENNLDQAKVLAKEGAKINRAKYPGLVNSYLGFLLTIAEREKDYDGQVDLLMKLFLDSHNNKFSYFEKLRSVSTKQDWPVILKKIVSQINNTYDLAMIYSIEKDWPQVLAAVRRSNSHHLANQYFKELSKLFPKELVEIYERFVFEGVDYAGGRGDYAQRANFLKTISDLGYSSRAKEISTALKEKYKNRRAMLQEFMEAGF